MLPIRTSSIFRSRWIALLWAGGIIWGAIEFAGSAPPGSGNTASAQVGDNAPDDADVKQVRDLLEHLPQ